jgi:hypothetical protein
VSHGERGIELRKRNLLIVACKGRCVQMKSQQGLLRAPISRSALPRLNNAFLSCQATSVEIEIRLLMQYNE